VLYWKAMIVRRTLGALAAVLALGALAATGGATAAPVANPIPGIVDIYTNLAYQGAEAAGTGIVVKSNGVVLTNNHVIRGATTIKVVDLDNGKTYRANVLGYALGADVAAIKLQNGLATAPLGRSNNLHVGQSVTTHGNAGGAGGTPSSATGKIVGLGRSITARDDSGNAEKLTGLIETDAALQPGDSGGPMVDSSGHVIGMDTAASSSFTFQDSVSRGFAVPIDRATKIVAQILAGRQTAGLHIGGTAFMGVSVRSTGNFEFGQVTSGAGVVVAQVIPGTPVAKAGLNPGDVLTKFDGKTVGTPTKLTSLVVTKHPGDTVEIRWVDQYGTAHTAKVRLAAGPPQ
jgi:S1-C subfamily serine protease